MAVTYNQLSSSLSPTLHPQATEVNKEITSSPDRFQKTYRYKMRNKEWKEEFTHTTSEKTGLVD